MIRQDFFESSRQSQLIEKMFNRLDFLMEDIRDDTQMAGWTQTDGEQTPTGDLALITENQLMRRSRVMFLKNPHGKGILRTLIKFIIGSGFLIDFSEEDKAKKKTLLKWWKKVKKKAKLIRFFREFVTRLFRDGEVFVWRFLPDENSPDDIISRIRFIDPDNVKNINTTEDDVENIISYTLNKPENLEIEAQFIVHCKINVDGNVKRGRGFLEPILPLLTKYDKWIEARMLLNIVRTSIALVQEVNGPSTDLFRLRSSQASNKGATNETDRAKMVRPGTILRGTPGVKYNMLSPNLDAKDASEDGRNIELNMAVAAGLPDTFVTMNYQHSNFASTVVAQNPALREFEDWQLYISEPFMDIIEWFLEDGVNAGIISKDTDLDFDIMFPPLLRRDVGQETLANQAMNQAGVMSRRTWGLRAGLDPDDEEEQIDVEGGPIPLPQAAGVDRPNSGNPQLGQTNAIPKGVSDRAPRQNVKAESVTESIEEQPKKRGRKPKVVVVNVKGEGKVIKPFTLEYETEEHSDATSNIDITSDQEREADLARVES